MDAKKRSLTEAECAALNQMAGMLELSEREKLLQDLENCEVLPQTEDGSRLLFVLDGYSRPQYQGQHAYPTEGLVRDADGAELFVCIYADHLDRLLELELIKWGDAAIQQPNWNTFVVRY